MNTFEENYKAGLVGEGKIAKWFMQKGYNVLPVYQIEKKTGKGPRLFLSSNPVIAPDMLVFNDEKTYWIEAKHKTAFSWHRITQKWVTGIDIRHYTEYLEVDKKTKWPVWLMFLHDGGHAKDSTDISPSGLFGNSLEFLKDNENHRHSNWGNSGMVYWGIDSLIKITQ